MTTVVGVALSVGTAYLATHFNNIMDFLQLVFGFVNAPLFATFLLGMFWKRTTGHGAFTGLLAGTAAAAATHGLTLAEGKGGWLGTVLHHVSVHHGAEFLDRNFRLVHLFFGDDLGEPGRPRPKPQSELHNLVYGLTDIPHERDVPWHHRPVLLALVVIAAVVVLNVLFR